MPALTRPINAKVGEDWQETYAVADQDGEPAEWIGWVARAEIRRTAGDTVETATLTVDTSETGYLTVTLPYTETQALTPPFVGEWDLLAISPAGLRQYLVEGTVTIRARVTR